MAMFRKDIRVGFLIGAVALVGGVGYLLFAGDSKPEADPGVDAMTAAVDPAAPAEMTKPRDAITPGTSSSAAGTAGSAAATPDDLLGATSDAPWDADAFRSPPPPQVTLTPPPRTGTSPLVTPGGDLTASLDRTLGGITAPAKTAPPAAKPDVPAGGTAHAIESGENFSTLAKKFYGDGNLYYVIQKANPSVDPTRLKIGQSVTIPDRAAAEAAKPAVKTDAKPDAAKPDAPADSGYTHVVSGSDTLYSIAEKRLGRAALWKEIYELNKSTIGGDPTKLQVGMTLRLPK